MLLNAELLLKYLRCRRRIFLDTHGDLSQRDVPNDLLLKLQEDKLVHKTNILAQWDYQKPDYPKRDWQTGAKATLALMHQGVDCIYRGVLLVNYQPQNSENTFAEEITLLSCPDLLFKQPGNSVFGDWVYVPAQIELGKRPKLEYQIVAAFHAQVLATIQESEPNTAWLMLRRKDAYAVNLAKWHPQMQESIEGCIQTLAGERSPEVFISRQRCSLCHWLTQCYAIAKSQNHLSLLPGVTPNRYSQLQAANILTVESLAQTSSAEIEILEGFDQEIASKLVLQAQSMIANRPIFLSSACESTFTADIELYFDIEAQPDLNLDYLLGVLVVNRLANTTEFYSFIAETPEDEGLVWQEFLQLVWQYPDAPIFHFCAYEVDTIKRLAKVYRTERSQVQPILNRCVDIYEKVTQTVVLPIESYALKSIARWLEFEWRDPQANGSQCIYWYDQWLETGDRTLLNTIVRYNEDDCRATYHVKDWLVELMNTEQVSVQVQY